MTPRERVWVGENSYISLSVAVVTTNKGPSPIWPANTKVVREGRGATDKRGAASSTLATPRGPLTVPRAVTANAIVFNCEPYRLLSFHRARVGTPVWWTGRVLNGL